MVPVKNAVVISHQIPNKAAGLPLKSCWWFGLVSWVCWCLTTASTLLLSKKIISLSLLMKLEMSGLAVWVNQTAEWCVSVNVIILGVCVCVCKKWAKWAHADLWPAIGGLAAVGMTCAFTVLKISGFNRLKIQNSWFLKDNMWNVSFVATEISWHPAGSNTQFSTRSRFCLSETLAVLPTVAEAAGCCVCSGAWSHQCHSESETWLQILTLIFLSRRAHYTSFSFFLFFSGWGMKRRHQSTFTDEAGASGLTCV